MAANSVQFEEKTISCYAFSMLRSCKSKRRTNLLLIFKIISEARTFVKDPHTLFTLFYIYYNAPH